MKKGTFIIGKYNFEIDKKESIFDFDSKTITNLRIVGKEKKLEEYLKTNDFPFDWIIYPPEFYANEISLNKNGKFELNQDNKYNHECAIYMMEHFDTLVKFYVDSNFIKVTGELLVDDDKYAIEIEFEL